VYIAKKFYKIKTRHLPLNWLRIFKKSCQSVILVKLYDSCQIFTAVTPTSFFVFHNQEARYFTANFTLFGTLYQISAVIYQALYFTKTFQFIMSALGTFINSIVVQLRI